MSELIPHSAAGGDNFVTNLNIHFLKELDVNPPDITRTVYTQKPWNPVEGDRVTFDSYALPTYAERVGENESYPLVGITEGDTKTVLQQQYGVKFNYTVRMKKFDKEQLAVKAAARMATMLNMVLELEMAHGAFADAEDTTYTPRNQSSAVTDDWLCANGLPFISGSQTVNGLPSTTKSNDYDPGSASYITENLLVDMMEHGRQNMVADDGTPCDWNPDEWWIGPVPAMIRRCKQILGSDLVPLSNDNSLNVFGPKGLSEWNFKLMVFKKATLAADGKTQRTTDTALYRHALFDSRYRESLQYSVAGDPMARINQGSTDNAQMSILYDLFAAHVRLRYQGIVMHRTNVAKPV